MESLAVARLTAAAVARGGGSGDYGLIKAVHAYALRIAALRS